jgi:hypothetical protein
VPTRRQQAPAAIQVQQRYTPRPQLAAHPHRRLPPSPRLLAAEMEVYQARLESFHKQKRVKHSSTKRTASVRWPHADDIAATPDALAEAGFFWAPTWEDRDNVACFLCNKELSGWEPADDPLAVHFDKCASECAWAAVRCGLPLDQDRKGRCAAPFFLPEGCR